MSLKTVIPNLEVYGYEWKPGNLDASSIAAGQDYLWWPQCPQAIDVFAWYHAPLDNTISVHQAWNSVLDKNHEKQSFRAIVLSWWVYKIGQGRQPGDLERVQYHDVVEEKLAFIP